jgi:hypothetical protein
VERYGALGGLATGGLVLYMDGVDDGQGQRCVAGLPWEILQRLNDMGGLATAAPLKMHVDSEALQVLADALCAEAGVEVRFHSLATQALVTSHRLEGVLVETKAGPQVIHAKVTIDATGDGDIAAQAGASYAMGYQRIGLNLKLGGIDHARWEAFEREEPERMRELLARLRAQGGFPLRPSLTPHSEAGVFWVNVLGVASRNERRPSEPGTAEGMIATYAGELDALNVEDLSYAQSELRRRAWLSLGFYRDRIPGFESASLLSFASQLGVRDSRRILGRQTLAGAAMRSGASQPDSIGMAGLTFGEAGHYQIPYGCLVPQELDGLLVAGRCISADEWAQQRARLIPAAMVTGQAAGTAAALAARSGASPQQLDVADLQRHLEYNDVRLD